MYDRIFKLNPGSSAFIFGPRGTGKTSWLKANLKGAPYFDLLDDEIYFELQRNSKFLYENIPSHYKGPVIIDEIQKLPHLLDKVRRLIEKEPQKKYQFIL